MEKVALAVMRLQPLHVGHKLLIDRALEEASIVLVGIGSIDKKDERNPFTFGERKEMIFALYGGEARLKVFGLRDIEAKTKSDWVEYVLSEIDRLGLPKPTVYYAGGKENGEWFSGILPVRIVDRVTEGEGVSSTAIRKTLLNGAADSLPIPEAVKLFLRNRR
jgi:bifunctional NMN adenylyltransferase/nudix hydrolase